MIEARVSRVARRDFYGDVVGWEWIATVYDVAEGTRVRESRYLAGEVCATKAEAVAALDRLVVGLTES